MRLLAHSAQHMYRTITICNERYVRLKSFADFLDQSCLLVQVDDQCTRTLVPFSNTLRNSVWTILKRMASAFRLVKIENYKGV